MRGRRGGVESRGQRFGAARRTRSSTRRRRGRRAASCGSAWSAIRCTVGSCRIRVGSSSPGSARRRASASPTSGSARSSTPVTSRKRRLRASPVRSTVEQRRRCRRAASPGRCADRAPNQSTTVESGVAQRGQAGHLEGHGHGVGGRRSAAEHDAVADDGDVPLAVAVVVDGTDRRVGDAQSGDAPAQQRWRHQRGDEDDDQQGGVLVVAEDSLGEADRGEDDPDLAARDHADADEQPIDTQAAGAAGRRQLADARRRPAARRPGRAPPAWPSPRGRRRGRSARRTPGSARWRRRRTRARRGRAGRCGRSPGRRRRRR